MKKLIYLLIGFLIGLFLGFMLWGYAEPVEACTDHIWEETQLSICIPKYDCGSEGTQTQTLTCKYERGENDECSTHFTWVDDEYEIRYADKYKIGRNWYCPSKNSSYTSTDSTKACSRNVKVKDGYWLPETKEVTTDCVLEDFVACDDGGDDEVIDEVVDEVVRVETPLTEAGALVCSDVAPSKVPNIYVLNAGVGQLEVRWIPTGGEKAHIFYGEKVGEPTYSLIDTENDGTEVIGGLNSGVHYWFAVVNGGGCAWSSLSDWYDPIVE